MAEEPGANPGGIMRRSSLANNSLYAGMGVTTFGLICILLSVGKMGLMTPILRGAGPWITLVGLSIVLVRVAFCFVPNNYTKPCFGKKTRNFVGMDREQSNIMKDTNQLIEEVPEPTSLEASDPTKLEI